MKEIKLTNGGVALVDDEDFERVNSRNWYLEHPERNNGNNYAITSNGWIQTKNGRKRQSFLRMHRFIIGAKKGQEVDHRDGNRLNNMKANLRICTHAENSWNKPYVGSKSGFKGVYRHVLNGKDMGTWRVKLKANNKFIHVGLYKTKEDAIVAYRAAATKHHGEFARVS